MLGKLLRGFGVCFVLFLVAAAAAGLMIVKDRVNVVITADRPAAGPEPLALLRDDVQNLQQSLQDMQGGMNGNLEKLAAALDERASSRHGDVQALRNEVAVVRASLDRALAAQAALQRDLQALATAQAARPADEPATSPTPVASDASPAPAATPPDVVSPTAPAVPAAEPPAAKTNGFLSFSLPTSKFRFDEAQDYVLLPELSRVGFDAKSTLHDFTGVTSAVRGRFRADFDDPDGAWTGDVVVQAATLDTGVAGRDEGLRERLDVEHHPELSFKIEKFVPGQGGVDVAKQTAAGEVVGTMTIRGQARSVRMAVQVEVDAQKRVVLRGQMPLKLSDYGVPVPSQLGVINMQDEVNVWIALRARQQSGAKK